MYSAAQKLEGIVKPFITSFKARSHSLHFLFGEILRMFESSSLFDVPGRSPLISIATDVSQRNSTVGPFQYSFSALSSNGPETIVTAGKSLEAIHVGATALVRINPPVVFDD